MRDFLRRNTFACVLLLTIALHAGAAWLLSLEKTEPPTALPSRVGKASMSVRASRGVRPKVVGEGGPGSKASKIESALTAAELDLPPLADTKPIALPAATTSRPISPIDRQLSRPPQPRLPDLKADTRATAPDLSELPALGDRKPAPPLAPRVQPGKAPELRAERTAAPARLPDLKAATRSSAPLDLSDLPPLSGLTGQETANLPPPAATASTLAPRYVRVNADAIAPGGLQRPGRGGSPDLPELKSVTEVGDVGSYSSRGSAGSDGIEGVELPTTGIVNPPPIYPPDALARGLEGKGKLLIKIDATGRVASIRIHISSGIESMDQSALDAHRRWVFNPAKRNGRPGVAPGAVPSREVSFCQLRGLSWQA